MVRFWKPEDPYLIQKCLIAGLILVLCVLLLYRLFKWLHRRREQKAFYDRLAMHAVSAEDENVLVDLVNHNLDILASPTEIFRSLRLFDMVASQEITRVLSSGGPVVERQETMDRIYALRSRLFPASRVRAMEELEG